VQIGQTVSKISRKQNRCRLKVAGAGHRKKKFSDRTVPEVKSS
jgi:hypothetical protein